MAVRTKAGVRKRATLKKPRKDISASYNRFKTFEGKQYTGVRVGRGHKWFYDHSIWLDKKVTPDKWLISFAGNKRRSGKAPIGSGAPVGTEYHWFILAHQIVKKIDANDYNTAMNGVKYKLSHKRTTKKEWNIGDTTQRNHLIKILEGFIEELKHESLDDYTAELPNPEDAEPKRKTIKKTKIKEAEPELAEA